MQTCIIDSAAKVGENVKFGTHVRVYGNVEIGDDCQIGDFVILGHPSRLIDPPPLGLGRGAIVRSHTILYEGTSIGDGLETGHHVVVREGSIIGENLRIGSFSDVEDHVKVGNFVRLHGYVHLGKGTTIGNFSWIFSLTTTMNDPLPPSHIFEPASIGDMVTVCVDAKIMPGTTIGDGSFICAGARASGRVPPGSVVDGDGGKVVGRTKFLMHMSSRIRHPWYRHFADAYPERARAQIEALVRSLEG